MSQYITVGGWLDKQRAPNTVKISFVFDQRHEDYTGYVRSLRGTIPRPVIEVAYALDNKYRTVTHEINVMDLLPHERLTFVLI